MTVAASAATTAMDGHRPMPVAAVPGIVCLFVNVERLAFDHVCATPDLLMDGGDVLAQ